MADVSEIMLSHKEIAELLVKNQCIHEGLWGIQIKFGIQGANIGSGPDNLHPAAIVPIIQIGIRQYTESSSLTVDAAVVNPKKKKTAKKKAKSKAPKKKNEKRKAKK